MIYGWLAACNANVNKQTGPSLDPSPVVVPPSAWPPEPALPLMPVLVGTTSTGYL